MKLTQILYKQHLGRMTKFNWFMVTKRKLIDYGVESNLESKLSPKGIRIVDPDEILKKPPANPQKVEPLLQYMIPSPPVAKNEKHPDWKETPCYMHNDNDLLVLGMNQALALTKTLNVKDSLPERIENLIEDTSEEINKSIERIVYTSNIFDAHQEKLPIRKDPMRPAWKFPRDYGIPDFRKSRNLCISMIQLCELLSGPSVSRQKQLVQNGVIKVPIEKEGNLIMFNMNIDLMIASKQGIKPMGSFNDTEDLTLPDLYPMTPIVNLQKSSFYQIEDVYPISMQSPYNNVHTIFVYHNVEKVINFSELPVQENQLHARSLMKSFTTAAASARVKYGHNVEHLPEPITIQCIQSNSQSFHFSVFQLNTLNINGTDGTCNFWWSSPPINLFTKALYEKGIPVVEGYNPEVFKRVLAFYKNV